MNNPISQQLLFAQALSAVVETLFNQALVYNLHGTRGLKALQHKTLTVQLAELGFPLSFSVNDEKVHVRASAENSDCCLITSLSSLHELHQQQQLTALIKQEKLDITGDIKVAQRFADLAESLDIDWQSELAKRIGDIPSYKIGQLGQALTKKLRFAKQQIQADASEWLIHEKRLVVANSEINTFSGQVSELSQQVGELTRQIDQLVASSANKA